MTKTIDAVFDNGNIYNVKFKDGTECMAFKDSKFGAPLEAGQEAEAVIVTKTSKASGKQYEQLTQWGTPQPRGGGGGFQKAMKTPADIACMAVCNANTAAVEHVKSLVQFGLLKEPQEIREEIAKVHEMLIARSRDAIESVKGVCG